MARQRLRSAQPRGGARLLLLSAAAVVAVASVLVLLARQRASADAPPGSVAQALTLPSAPARPRSTRVAPDQGAVGPSPSSAAAVRVPLANADTPVVEISSPDDLAAVFREAGIEDPAQAQVAWLANFGFLPYAPDGTLLLDLAYPDYDEATLQNLANGGDMWAAQSLADRLVTRRPADAVALYEQAAAQGSAYAMRQLAVLYRLVGSSAAAQSMGGARAASQLALLRESSGNLATLDLAWRVVADRQLRHVNTGAGSELPDLPGDAWRAACDRALELERDLASLRARRSLTAPTFAAPPFVIDGPTPLEQTRCWRRDDREAMLSACRAVRVGFGSETGLLWICDDASSLQPAD